LTFQETVHLSGNTNRKNRGTLAEASTA